MTRPLFGLGHLETIVITVPKNEFKEFMLSELSALVNTMFQVSQKYYMPTSLSLNAGRPEDELMLTLRRISSINARNGPYEIPLKPASPA